MLQVAEQSLETRANRATLNVFLEVRCVILWQISGKRPRRWGRGSRLCWWARQGLNL
jgi:hypothetical protein